MEMEPGEGKKHEMAETEQEELREGAEPDDMPAGKTNRKRSAKGAKNTKAPMDGEGCSCGARKGKASCDGNCGGYGKKMDRNDALTPQEYLAACDLGIQGRPRSYIRARLDAAARLDLKCGKGSISQGEKCHKGLSKKSVKAKEKSAKAQQLVNGLGIAAGVTGAALLGVWAVNAIKAERSYRAWLRATRSEQRLRTRMQVRGLEQQQSTVAAANRQNPSSDFMRGFGEQPPQRPVQSRETKYRPHPGSSEAKVQAALTSSVPYAGSRYIDPNPDVSAAWTKVKRPQPKSRYKGDPDLSGIWARGFRP